MVHIGDARRRVEAAPLPLLGGSSSTKSSSAVTTQLASAVVCLYNFFTNTPAASVTSMICDACGANAVNGVIGSAAVTDCGKHAGMRCWCGRSGRSGCAGRAHDWLHMRHNFQIKRQTACMPLVMSLVFLTDRPRPCARNAQAARSTLVVIPRAPTAASSAWPAPSRTTPFSPWPLPAPPPPPLSSVPLLAAVSCRLLLGLAAGFSEQGWPCCGLLLPTSCQHPAPRHQACSQLTNCTSRVACNSFAPAP